MQNFDFLWNASNQEEAGDASEVVGPVAIHIGEEKKDNAATPPGGCTPQPYVPPAKRFTAEQERQTSLKMVRESSGRPDVDLIQSVHHVWTQPYIQKQLRGPKAEDGVSPSVEGIQKQPRSPKGQDGVSPSVEEVFRHMFADPQFLAARSDMRGIQGQRGPKGEDGKTVVVSDVINYLLTNPSVQKQLFAELTHDLDVNTASALADINRRLDQFEDTLMSLQRRVADSNKNPK